MIHRYLTNQTESSGRYNPEDTLKDLERKTTGYKIDSHLLTRDLFQGLKGVDTESEVTRM